jgi:hypothetical protein
MKPQTIILCLGLAGFISEPVAGAQTANRLTPVPIQSVKITATSY